MSTIFATERLIVREWEPESDCEQAFRIYSDPEVMRHLGPDQDTPGKLAESPDSVRDWIAERMSVHPRHHAGTGVWAIQLRETGEVVGTVMGKHPPDGNGILLPELEVGWHLARSHWGNGYATEAGRGAIEYLFRTFPIDRVIAVTYEANSASKAVMARVGMRYVGSTTRYYGTSAELFEIIRADVE